MNENTKTPFSRKGIPTRYKHSMFRSRLEARWACFFDIVGWRWDYEPIDLEGYIPDFILYFKNPVLVEVKPITRFEEFAPVAERIDGVLSNGTSSSEPWRNREVLILGARVWDYDEMGDSNAPAIGLLRHIGWDGSVRGDDDLAPEWLAAEVFRCAQECNCGLKPSCRDEHKPCGGISYYSGTRGWFCRLCWHHAKFQEMDMSLLTHYWREAGNAVQWHPLNDQ